MGYCSEVVIELTATGEAFLQKRLQEAPTDVAEDVRLCLAGAETHEAQGFTLRYWDWIKWYESYPDIAFLNETLQKLPPEAYGFIRIGEAYDDPTEILGNIADSPFCAGVTRSIVFDT